MDKPVDNFAFRGVVSCALTGHNECMSRYRPWELPEEDDSDDRYDAMKDAYAEGWGAPYNERTRREVERDADPERW